MNGPKIYFTIPLLGGIPITQTTVSSFAVMLLLCIAGIVLGSNLQKRPSRRQVLVEKGVTMLYGMVEDTMGKHNSYWTPYIGALFLSSIFGSYIGMTGIFRSSTADLSTTVTWALMTSVICWACSIKANGVLGWLKGFTEPVVVMTPMNLVSEIAQPISMAFRHFWQHCGRQRSDQPGLFRSGNGFRRSFGPGWQKHCGRNLDSFGWCGAAGFGCAQEKVGLQNFWCGVCRNRNFVPAGLGRGAVSGSRHSRHHEPLFRCIFWWGAGPGVQPVDDGLCQQCLPAA